MRTLILLFALSVTALISSCSKEEMRLLEGTWETPEEVYPIFIFNDGDLKVSFTEGGVSTGRYRISGSELSLDFDHIPEKKFYTMDLTETTLKLTIKRGDITLSYPYPEFNLVKK